MKESRGLGVFWKCENFGGAGFN